MLNTSCFCGVNKARVFGHNEYTYICHACFAWCVVVDLQYTAVFTFIWALGDYESIRIENNLV